MNDIKYRNRKYLAQYDLHVDLFESFDLKVTDAIPVRDVFMISTNRGNKILKKVQYDIEELTFIYDALQHIRNTFPRVLDFVLTKEGQIYKVFNGEMYCIMDLIEGRECEFSNPLDLKVAATGLAELHKASKGFKTNYHKKCFQGKAIEGFKRKLEEMQFFKNIASLHDKKSEFDEVFLENVEWHMKEIEKSIQLLMESNYYKLCSEEDKIVFCHHDLAHHNILIHNDKGYFIDFDYAIIDLKVHDLCNLMNKATKEAAFDIEKAKMIISWYREENVVQESELKVLYALLNFPEDFYNIGKDYYTRRKDWEEEVFVERLIRKVSYKEDREEFLEEFKNIK